MRDSSQTPTSKHDAAPDSDSRGLNVVCLATYFKGSDFMRECKVRGCRVMLVTKEKLLDEDWPRESLDELIALPDDADVDTFIYAVGQLGRGHKIHHVIALEEYDVITAGLIREHLCLAGTTSSTARLFRDKLAMRSVAHAAGIMAPEFVHLLNYNEVGRYMERVPPPWVIKPRSDVSAVGIKKALDSEQVWRTIDLLDSREPVLEKSPFYLLERFIPGDVFHVDAVVEAGKVLFAGVNGYGRPPMDVAHKGGVYISHTIDYESQDRVELLRINQKLITSLGLERGATHAEFIKSDADGRFYFLEIAARVGGAYIAEVLEAATGINLWREWARVEVASEEWSGKIVPVRQEHAGIVLSLARQEQPDTSGYNDPEIVYRVKKRHHVGLIIRSPSLERVRRLLQTYSARFDREFSAFEPPLEKTV